MSVYVSLFNEVVGEEHREESEKHEEEELINVGC